MTAVATVARVTAVAANTVGARRRRTTGASCTTRSAGSAVAAISRNSTESTKTTVAGKTTVATFARDTACRRTTGSAGTTVAGVSSVPTVLANPTQPGSAITCDSTAAAAAAFTRRTRRGRPSDSAGSAISSGRPRFGKREQRPRRTGVSVAAKTAAPALARDTSCRLTAGATDSTVATGDAGDRRGPTIATGTAFTGRTVRTRGTRASGRTTQTADTGESALTTISTHATGVSVTSRATVSSLCTDVRPGDAIPALAADTRCTTSATVATISIRARGPITTATTHTTSSAVSTDTTGFGRRLVGRRWAADPSDAPCAADAASSTVATIAENDTPVAAVTTSSTGSAVPTVSTVDIGCPCGAHRTNDTRFTGSTVAAIADLHGVAAITAHESVAAVTEKTAASTAVTSTRLAGSCVRRVRVSDTEDRPGIR